MRVVYALPLELREKFKEPFGTLLHGTSAVTMKQLNAIIINEKPPPTVISVGDRVSRNLHKHGIIPQLAITDNKSLRRNIQPAIFEAKKIIRVKNPQGTITDEAEAAVRTALKDKEHTHIVVDGEEDLLTPVAVLHAPENALIVYGQPYQGVVVVKATAEKRTRAKELLDLMACSKAK
jgi:uncharacterized protein (UPF0218 family)